MSNAPDPNKPIPAWLSLSLDTAGLKLTVLGVSMSQQDAECVCQEHGGGLPTTAVATLPGKSAKLELWLAEHGIVGSDAAKLVRKLWKVFLEKCGRYAVTPEDRDDARPDPRCLRQAGRRSR